MQKQHCALDRINLIETRKLQAATERGALAEAWRCCRGSGLSQNCGLASSSPAFEAWRKGHDPNCLHSLSYTSQSLRFFISFTVSRSPLRSNNCNVKVTAEASAVTRPALEAFD